MSTFRWGYKCHNALGWVLWRIIGFCRFIMNFSWGYAHYTNGWGPKIHKDDSVWERISHSWKYRNED